MSNLREKLITALMDESKTVIVPEANGVAIPRPVAEEVADTIIANGEAEKYLELLASEPTAKAIRALVCERAEQRRTAIQRVKAEEKRLREPRDTDPAVLYHMRGGQPGSWFDNEPAYEGGVSYEQSGAVREEMRQKVRSAFAK
jgi:hypothetical protein